MLRMNNIAKYTFKRVPKKQYEFIGFNFHVFSNKHYTVELIPFRIFNYIRNVILILILDEI